MSRGKSTRGTLGRPRQSLPGLQHSPCSAGTGPGPLQVPGRHADRAPRGHLPGTCGCHPIRPREGCLSRAPAVHDVVMSTAGTSPPGLSAPRFSPSSEQYVDGLPPGFVFPGTENLDPAEIFSGPGYTAPRPRSDSGATAALVCGLLSFIPLVGVAAIILGINALRRLHHSYNSGEGLAWLGLILGAVFVILWLCALILVLLVG